MGYPRWLYLNRTIAATLTATGGSTTSGFPLANLNDWRDYYLWAASGANSYSVVLDCGSAVTAASVALAGHNLHTCGARFAVLYSDNGSDWTDSGLGYVTPADDKCLARFFTSASHRYWKLVVDNNGGANFSPQLGMLFIGDYLEVPRFINQPFDPDRQKLHLSRGQSDSGRPLGTTEDFRERIVALSFDHLGRSWYDASFKPFWEECYDHPFVFAWDQENHPNDAWLMEWTTDDLNTPYDNCYRSPLTLEMRGLLE